MGWVDVKTLSGQKYDDTVNTVNMRMWMRMMKKEWWSIMASVGVMVVEIGWQQKKDWVAERRNRRSWDQDLRTGSCT